MKFEEKLITLRKQKLLSQEQLAEKLDVTRQTVSKWELGQSRPDMDKLANMSKLFNVSIDTLTNDDVSLDDKEVLKKETSDNKKNRGNRKFLLYIFILIFIASLMTLTYRVAFDIKKKQDAIKEEEKKEREEQKLEAEKIKKEQKEAAEKIKKKQEQAELKRQLESFNWSYENKVGVKTSGSVSYLIDDVMKNNTKKDNLHLIEFVFDGISYGTEPSNISNVTSKLKSFNFNNQSGFQEYEVSVEYDNDGYVNKVIVKTK